MFNKMPMVTPGSKSTVTQRPTTIARPSPDPESQSICRDLRRGCTDDSGARLLHRLPTEAERAALVRRQWALEVAGTAATPSEAAITVTQMLSGFPSYRAGEDEAEIMAAQYVTVLREFPSWAIRDACDEISSGRLVGDEVLNLNPAFPPSAEQVCIVTRREMRALERELKEVREVLTGRVEAPRENRPTLAQIQDRYGGTRLTARDYPPSGRRASIGDGKHAQRVAADLERRRTQQESAA